MRIRKMDFADAILLGPGVAIQEAFDIFWPDRRNDRRYDFRARLTKSNSLVLFPVLRMGGAEVDVKLSVGHLALKWPILPLRKHRGGYMTATARDSVESGRWPYADVDGNYIERRGKYTRTRHRVVYADRLSGHLVVDVLLRPRVKE
jgi:hypothetical protein